MQLILKTREWFFLEIQFFLPNSLNRNPRWGRNADLHLCDCSLITSQNVIEKIGKHQDWNCLHYLHSLYCRCAPKQSLTIDHIAFSIQSIPLFFFLTTEHGATIMWTSSFISFCALWFLFYFCRVHGITILAFPKWSSQLSNEKQRYSPYLNNNTNAQKKPTFSSLKLTFSFTMHMPSSETN